LVVFLVIDQLRGDMLTRYSNVFTGGLKRILDQGLSFPNALHGHSATETSPGHATLSTGTYPARAGIPSNAWREGEGRNLHPVYNVVDPEQALVGVPGLPGSSPSVLRRTGLADWILTADPEASVLSVSAKDRAAVLMAGRSKGNVFWFNSTVGRFVTSTYYRNRNPSWLSNFNEFTLEKFRADSVWVSTIPPQVADLSSPDTASFEGDGVHTYFPHRYYQERIDPGMDDFFLWFEQTPMLDDATLALAKLAMKELGTGTREGHTDFLSVSLSQTDRVGHGYGPLSREQMDNLLRLDRALGVFMDFLDLQVGPENYFLGLTSDHGIMTVPERMEVPGVRLNTGNRSQLEQALGQASREANQAGESSPGAFMVEHLKKMPFVGPAYSHGDLQVGVLGDSLAVLFQHSYTPDRFGGLLSPYGVEMWWSENTLDWTFPHGTTHGSPYYYDRWVPLLLVGPGIEAGEDTRPVQPMDLAPTLAWLAGIPFPEDLDGKPLLGGKD
jgi:predicted AlkP superfamily pyrophosphatase or phosphodiesterase